MVNEMFTFIIKSISVAKFWSYNFTGYDFISKYLGATLIRVIIFSTHWLFCFLECPGYTFLCKYILCISILTVGLDFFLSKFLWFLEENYIVGIIWSFKYFSLIEIALNY